MTRSIKKTIVVSNSADDVFNALITPSRINEWWASKTAIINPKAQGIWMASWGEDIDDPDYLTSAVMSVFEPGRRIVMTNYDYFAKSGELPFEAEFETAFEIRTTEDNETELTVVQNGFPTDPSADDFFSGCTKGWEETLQNLKNHLLITN